MSEHKDGGPDPIECSRCNGSGEIAISSTTGRYAAACCSRWTTRLSGTRVLIDMKQREIPVIASWLIGAEENVFGTPES